MSDAYGGVKIGKLKLKGEKKSKKKSRKRDRDSEDRQRHGERKRHKQEFLADIERHGGWWPASESNHISGPIAIQFGSSFVKAQDDGTFTLGAPHDEGSGPDPEEVLLAVKAGESKIALKSGFEKYLQVDNRDFTVRGTADAVGPMEQWEPVFQDGKLALLGANNRFLGINEDETLVCQKQKASDEEMIQIRSNAEREEDKKPVVPEEEQGNVGQVELNYVKKFQKFQDHKIRLNQSDRRELLAAKTDGSMHELMLDRRAKMKADRYCK